MPPFSTSDDTLEAPAVLYDIRTAATRRAIEKRATEDAWAAVTADWKRGFPRDLGVYARELASKFILYSAIEVPSIPGQMVSELEREFRYVETNALRDYYFEQAYTVVVEAIRDHIRATGLLPRVRKVRRNHG